MEGQAMDAVWDVVDEVEEFLAQLDTVTAEPLDAVHIAGPVENGTGARAVHRVSLEGLREALQRMRLAIEEEDHELTLHDLVRNVLEHTGEEREEHLRALAERVERRTNA
jgi:hypothetical protein